MAGCGRTKPTSPPQGPVVVLNENKKPEQAHLCIRAPGISQTAPNRYAAYVLNTALGGGMSSRLFQEVREKRGKVYSIYSFLSSYIDCGYFAIYARTHPEWVDEALESTLGELRKVIGQGLAETQLPRAQRH